MKNIFKKFHIGTNHHDHNRSNEAPTSYSSIPPQSSSTDHHRTRPTQNPAASPANLSTPADASFPATTMANQKDYLSSEEEFQVQLALAISASNSDSHYDQRLGSHQIDSRRNDYGVADALSRHYWEYNVLDYEEKVVDGFYDVYGLSTNIAMQGKMPFLTDLEAKPESSGLEVVIVDRTIDPALEELIQIAHCIALDCPATEVAILVQRLAELVIGHMGGPVKDANIILARWTERSRELRTSQNTSVLPIGYINIGLSRHRALLFKVLADNIKMPCRLVKGSHYTGVEDDAVNIIKLVDEREFLVDLMAAPGTLIPADISTPKDTYLTPDNPKVLPSLPSAKETDFYYTRLVPSHGEGINQNSAVEGSSPLNGQAYFDQSEYMPSNFGFNGGSGVRPLKMPNRMTLNQLENIAQPSSASMYKGIHGINIAGNRTRLDVNVVPYGQKNSDDSQSLSAELNPFQKKGTSKISDHNRTVESNAPDLQSTRKNTVCGRPPGPLAWKNCCAYNEVPRKVNCDPNDYNFPNSSPISEKFDHNGSKSSNSSNLRNDRKAPKLAQDNGSVALSGADELERVEDLNVDCNRGKPENYRNDMLDVVIELKNIKIGHLDKRKGTSDRFMGESLKLKGPDSRSSPIDSNTNKIDQMLDDVDVIECEIRWEDLVIGERIGLGSYGEVFRADWNGTEVAVKKFLDQDFSGDALSEFKREVRIMRRLRHPNVVNFIGAVTRPPNLSIITEFLPRGSLYHILHHPHCQIDEKQRIKIALDVARGMNCLHSSTPIVVHRDLKSLNLLVDENWNVKVCDFGLSRLKPNTFLSSKSTAGTPEWMAPEVLRNEPSNEKCDVYSFGVILWEIATLKLPWTGMNPMQVVAAVGFQDCHLDIPKDVDPSVASIIWECLQQDPNLRPSFAQLTVTLKPLQRLSIASHQDQLP
ncbi:PREDICTED: serine/threonine-protein kinase EDR1-like isoform X2 [Lupinus angustifolius]|uniref:serine/threonine-protein kinase EDR1-like isoform X2 n=1 Tax=Lupinus angustifolius TaxID=3871 RepID=UPI00092EEC02|nr:PREDICTED: serine/threonine-protein kinase EDR1-like isoform X2 [Lupinus angustifolius]